LLLMLFGIVLFFGEDAALIGRSSAAVQESAAAADWRRAEGLLTAGRGEEAYAIFTGLLAKFPGHNALRLGLARAAVLAGRPQEAAPIYAELSEKFPDVPAIAAEKEIVRRVLGGGNAPLSDSLTAWDGRIRAGLIYDSNANMGTTSERMELGNWLVRIPDAKRRETLAAYLGVHLNVNHRLGASSPWSVVGDMNFFLRGNGNPVLGDLHNREWQWGRIAGGVRYFKDRNLLDLRLKGEVIDYEFDNTVTAFGPELTYLRALTERVHLITSINGDLRFYRSAFDGNASERNGFYGQAGESIRFFWGDNSRYSVTVGGHYLWGELRDPKARYSYQGASVPLRFTCKATDDFELSPHASFTWEFYDDPATALEQRKRYDKRFRGGIDTSIRLTDNWSVEINYAYTKSVSTSALYTYDQHMVSAGVAWSF
jgi:hypothetical protein